LFLIHHLPSVSTDGKEEEEKKKRLQPHCCSLMGLKPS